MCPATSAVARPSQLAVAHHAGDQSGKRSRARWIGGRGVAGRRWLRAGN